MHLSMCRGVCRIQIGGFLHRRARSARAKFSMPRPLLWPRPTDKHEQLADLLEYSSILSAAVCYSDQEATNSCFWPQTKKAKDPGGFHLCIFNRDTMDSLLWYTWNLRPRGVSRQPKNSLNTPLMWSPTIPLLGWQGHLIRGLMKGPSSRVGHLIQPPSMCIGFSQVCEWSDFID